MLGRHRGGTIFWSVSVFVLFGMLAVQGQEKPLAAGQAKLEPLVTTDLAEVGLMGTSVAQRVTIAPETTTADHTHTGRTSIIVMLQGTMTEIRGTVKNEYKPGDVIRVAEGVTHHAENHGTVPLIYIEINTTAKK